jgi:glycosyltransferase involved in cell wall biosynthesis
MHQLPDSAGLRIGIDGRELLADRQTGIGRYLANFIRTMAPANPQHTFYLYGNQHTVVPEGLTNLVARLQDEANTMWWDQVILPRMLREDAMDVFLSPFDKAPAAAPCPVAVTVHDLTFLVHSDRRGLARILYNAAYRAIRGPLIRRADLVITDSEFSRQDIASRLGIPADRIRAVPIGVPDTHIPVRDPEKLIRFQSSVGITGPYVLYVGNFKPHKNVIGLVRAFAGLPEGLRSSHQLVLCGSRDAFRNGIEAEAGKLGLSDRVLFPGFVADADMATLYSGAAVFVLPSLYEGFGLGNLEAMVCGTPVVSSSAASMPEVVGDAGILVDATRPEEIAEAVAGILADPALRQCLSERSLARASLFTREQTSGQILKCLEELAASGRHPEPRPSQPESGEAL